MSNSMTPDEVRKERNRVKKRLSRQRQKESCQIVDLSDKRRRVIQNICQGVKVRSDLKKLGITIDTIPCDESMINTDVLEQLKSIESSSASSVLSHERDNISCSSPSVSYQLGEDQMYSSLQPEQMHNHNRIKIRVKVKPITKFSQLDANHVYERIMTEKRLAKKTVNNYIASLDKILKLINCQVDDIIPYLRSHELVLSTLQKEYPNMASYKSMLSCVISLIKHSPNFGQLLGQNVIDTYRQEMVRVREHLDHKQNEKADHGVTISWTEIIEMRKQLSIQNPDSTEYLVLCLYTMIPTMRDNFGKVALIDECEEDMIPLEESDVYYVNTGRLIISHYKTHKQYGNVDIVLPKRLQMIIRRSIELRPRKYLVTQKRSSNLVYDPSKGGKLSAIIKLMFGFGIDDMRHSFATYLDQHRQQFSISERRIIYHIMGHSAGMSEFYARQGTKESRAIEVTTIGPDATEMEMISHKMGGDV